MKTQQENDGSEPEVSATQDVEPKRPPVSNKDKGDE